MCTGIELLGMLAGPVLSGVGSMIQQKEMEANQRRMAEARNNELRRVLTKNDELAQRSRETFDARRKASQGEQLEADQKKAEENRQTELTEVAQSTPAPAQNVALSGSAPTVVKSQMAKQMASAIGDA